MLQGTTDCYNFYQRILITILKMLEQSFQPYSPICGFQDIGHPKIIAGEFFVEQYFR